MVAVVGLLGTAGCGKDTVAEALTDRGWKRLAFADRLKAAALDADPIVHHGTGAPVHLSTVVDRVGWDEAKRFVEVRGFLQRLGVAVREHVDPEAWVAPVMSEARDYLRAGVPVVVTDVRFRNELTAIRSVGGRCVLVERPGLRPPNGHVSERLAAEAWQAGLVSELLVNDGTLHDLRVQVSVREREWLAGEGV